MASTSLRASGFSARKPLKELMAKQLETANIYWSNWGMPSAEDQNLAGYAISRPGWEWGIMAGCVLVTRPDKKADGTVVPAPGPKNAMLAGRLVEVWPYMWERKSDSSLLPLLLMKVEIMPKQYIMVSVCTTALKPHLTTTYGMDYVQFS